MRDYRFRGKRVDNGEWVYGGIEQSPHVTLVYDMELPYCNQVPVIPETVGQSTGLHDKNGKEIYEGDVVFDSQKKLKGHITFLLQEMGFVIVYEKFDSRLGHRNRGGGYDFDVTLEVIGNIHDQEASDE